jgi:hypothetical protein
VTSSPKKEGEVAIKEYDLSPFLKKDMVLDLSLMESILTVDGP